jgi:hypothetical protein
MVARAPEIALALPLRPLCYLRGLLVTLAASTPTPAPARFFESTVLLHPPYPSLRFSLSGSPPGGLFLRLSQLLESSVELPDFEIVFQLLHNPEGFLTAIYPVSYQNYFTNITYSAPGTDKPSDPILRDFATSWLRDLEFLNYLGAANYRLPLPAQAQFARFFHCV